MTPGGTIPNRMGGRFGSSSGVRSGGQTGNNNPGGGPAMSAVPTRNSAGATGTQLQNNMSVEDQQLMVVAQHLKAQQENHPSAPIFPPTPFDAQAGVSGNGPPVPNGSR
jgi:hypothetical protein